jgi:uncharacterized protein with FMN-binding domain
MTTTARRLTYSALAGLTLMGALAACAPADEEDTTATEDTTTEESAEESTTPDTDAGSETDAAAAGDYADGTYEASGDYQSPNGTETVDVTLTLEGDIVTDVEVVGHAEVPNSVRFQGEFIDGIADEVVGQDIDSLAVDKVGGSSLTSGGFNDALETIKSEAAA